MTKRMLEISAPSQVAKGVLAGDDTPEGLAEITWLDVRKVERTETADKRLLSIDVVSAMPYRVGKRYPRQRNYQGDYYFAQVQRHVWHESLLEMRVLRWMDVHEHVEAIASQPFKILFSDGTSHVPDYFAKLRGYRQLVIDVKPTTLIDDKARTQFRKTRAVCAQIGWEYEIRSERTAQEDINLEFVAAFKHPAFRPQDQAISQLMAALARPLSIQEAAEALQQPTLAEGRSAVYHLICARVLHLDLTSTLSDTSLVERNDHAFI